MYVTTTPKPTVYVCMYVCMCMAVPTTSGTGSECTKNAVLKCLRNNRKVSIRSDKMFAVAAVKGSHTYIHIHTYTYIVNNSVTVNYTYIRTYNMNVGGGPYPNALLSSWCQCACRFGYTVSGSRMYVYLQYNSVDIIGCNVCMYVRVCGEEHRAVCEQLAESVCWRAFKRRLGLLVLICYYISYIHTYIHIYIFRTYVYPMYPNITHVYIHTYIHTCMHRYHSSGALSPKCGIKWTVRYCSARGYVHRISHGYSSLFTCIHTYIHTLFLLSTSKH
jgi:hypothetical protein